MSGGDSFNEDRLAMEPATAVDLLALLYEEGLIIKRQIKDTLAEQRMQRLYETSLFDIPSGIRSYVVGMNCAELYLDWRSRVLAALRRTDVPKYLMLKFTNAPEVLLERSFRVKNPELQFEKALANVDQALSILLDIIRDMPQQTVQSAISEPPAPIATEAPSYRLWADMENRRLIIHAGTRKLVAKHRLAYNGNPHKLLRSMLQHKGQELTKDQAGLPGNLKVSNVVQGIGFKGLIHRKLLDSGYSTVTLKDGALITERELGELLAGCQGDFDIQ